MSASPIRRLVALAGLALVPAATLSAEQFEAVASRASPDYVRPKLPNGTYATETYAFGKGGYWSGPLNDQTIDKMDFMDIARVIAVPLASQQYLPAKDPKTTRLLIMVYWGTTYAPEHASESQTYQNAQQARDAVNVALHQDPPSVVQALEDNEMLAIAEVQRENHRRDQQNARNAEMLGYESWWQATYTAHAGTPQERERQDMMAELEEARYFVVLMAYDFPILLREKKHKLLWETRFSIREHNNAFDQQLPAMAVKAAEFFGKNSHGLVHDALPQGKVDIGTLRDLGEVPTK